MNADYLNYEPYLSPIKKKLKYPHRKRKEQMLSEDGFKCLYCGAYVAAQAFLSGVQHRNHCPYCLWSRHLDLSQAGDRLSACKSPMEPLGLSIKRVNKKYAPPNPGELMIVHRCLECGKVSANRIAADDDVDRMLDIFSRSASLSRSSREQLVEAGIAILDPTQEYLVHLRLLGN